MTWLREFIARRFATIFVATHHERILSAVHCRGEIFIVTDGRLLRYDPERDEIRTEHNIGSY